MPGSWNTIPIPDPRWRARSRSGSPTSSVPSSRMLPVTYGPGGLRPISAKAVIDLPEPDAPMTPRRRPGGTVNVTRSRIVRPAIRTVRGRAPPARRSRRPGRRARLVGRLGHAVTPRSRRPLCGRGRGRRPCRRRWRPRSPRRPRRRRRRRSTGVGVGGPVGRGQPRVRRVTDGIAEERQRRDHERDRGARPGRTPRVHADVRLQVGQERPPRRRVRPGRRSRGTTVPPRRAPLSPSRARAAR